jgi:hypothetical protein
MSEKHTYIYIYIYIYINIDLKFDFEWTKNELSHCHTVTLFVNHFSMRAFCVLFLQNNLEVL